MLDSCWYRVEDNQEPDLFPTMLSLAFCFDPIDQPLVDTSGLVEKNPLRTVDEASLARRILSKTGTFLDLDSRVEREPSLYARLEKETKSLLRSARYQVDEYADWAYSKRVGFGRA